MTSPSDTRSDAAAQADVVDILTADHHEVLDLIDMVGTQQGPDDRRDSVETVIAELVRHSVAEEMYVYPAIRRHFEDGDEVVDHDTQEHKDLEKTMLALEHASPASDEFGDLVSRLREQLVHHATDEEQEQFPRLREKIPAADLVELGEKVRTAKAAAPTRPHPASPNAELFHKTLGPGVGLIDKLRDALTGRARNT